MNVNGHQSEERPVIVTYYNGFFSSWKTSEKWFLDALEKIKAIGNEVF